MLCSFYYYALQSWLGWWHYFLFSIELPLKMFHYSLRNFCNIDSYSIKLNQRWTHLTRIMTLLSSLAALYLDRICFIIYELCNIDCHWTEPNQHWNDLTSIMTAVFSRADLVETDLIFLFISVKKEIWIV